MKDFFDGFIKYGDWIGMYKNPSVSEAKACLIKSVLGLSSSFSTSCRGLVFLDNYSYKKRGENKKVKSGDLLVWKSSITHNDMLKQISLSPPIMRPLFNICVTVYVDTVDKTVKLTNDYREGLIDYSTKRGGADFISKFFKKLDGLDLHTPFNFPSLQNSFQRLLSTWVAS